MTAIAWNSFWTVTGTVASIVGLVFSLMAWIQAAKAKDAAREAAEGVRKRNAAQQVMKLAGDAKEFLSSVQQTRKQDAISAANSLLHSLALLNAKAVADAGDTDTLRTSQDMITEAAIRLNLDEVAADSSEERAELLILCHKIHRSVCELAGDMERLSEGARE